MAKKHEVVTEQSVQEADVTEAVVAAAPTELAVDFAGGYGADHEGQAVKLSAADVIIPTLRIVQESSKVYKAYKGNEAARPFELGDIYDSSTGKFYSGKVGVVVVPIELTDAVVERKASPDGSFIAKLKTKDHRVQEALAANGSDGWRQLKSAQKTQLVYTDEVLVALLDPSDNVTPVSAAVVPFSGTNVFPRKQWWNQIAAVPYAKITPLYAFRTVLKTELRKATNSGGVDSYKFRAEPFGGNWSSCRQNPKTAKEALTRCLQLLNLYSSGILGKADYSDADDSEEALEAAAFAEKPAF